MLGFFWTRGKGNEILNQRNSDQLSEVKITARKPTVWPAHSVFAGWILFLNLALSPKIFRDFRMYNKYVTALSRTCRKCNSSLVCLCMRSLPKASWCGSVWDPSPACWFLPGCPVHHCECSLTSDQAQPLPHLHMDHAFIVTNIFDPCSLRESWKEVTIQEQ